MPQMMPLYWSFYFFVFFIFINLFLVLLFNFFMFNNMTKKYMISSNYTKLNYKW